MSTVIRMRTAMCVAVVAGVATVGVAVPTGAVAAPAQRNCAEPGEVVTQVPWPQQWLGPERVWPFTRGGGVTVAVLDSGVDASHPQLRGQVGAGFDAVAGSGAGNSDCAGTGTQIAGVVAGRQAGTGGPAGMAPDAGIFPVRVVAERGSGTAGVDPEVLARGISAAVDRGAGVIAVPVVAYTDHDALRGAVARAVARGALVIAAVGDLGDANGGNPKPYPASYDGVIGVGAIDRSGARWARSQVGDYVDLVAPGADVITLQRGRGMGLANGTGVACGFVAGAAALIRSKRGDLTAKEITRLLLATASPAPAGPEYGHGVVNAYSAVNDQVAKGSPVALPALPPRPVARSSAWARSRDLALLGAGVAVLVVLAVLAVAVALPRGRRRLWRAALAPPARSVAEPDEPGPPVLLFDERR